MSESEGTVEQLVLLWGDGRVGAAFNIVIVAEGYRDDDLDTFAGDARAVLGQLKANEPFASNIDAFNVFRLDVASDEAGADDQTGQRATYFDAHFEAYPPQLLLVNAELVETTIQDQLREGEGAEDVPVHKAIVLVNTPRDGGSGGIGEAVCVCSREYGAANALHELGHTFGLTDEYTPEGPGEVSKAVRQRLRELEAVEREAAWDAIWPNLSISPCKDDLPQPWAALIKLGTRLPTTRKPEEPPLPLDTVGAFADLDSSFYRPQWECTMRDSEDTFCAVCANYILTQIQGH
jgi:hypothetical protein